MKTSKTIQQIVFLFFIFTFFVSAQNTSTSEKKTQSKEEVYKEQNTTFIEKSFRENVIDAYQLQAITKLNDFYSQLNLLSHSKDTIEQAEIQTAILRNFFRPSIQVKNFFTNNQENSSIETAVALAGNSQLTFTISNFEYKAIGETYFLISYFLNIQSLQQSTKQQITHKIYLFPFEKQFGTNNKTVWELKLGEFYVQSY